MIKNKTYEFFTTDSEMKTINHRIQLLKGVLGEIKKNEKWMELCGGKVWKWFGVGNWKEVLVDRGLSDEGKSKMMRLCVLEKVKYNNMGDNTLKRFVKKVMMDVKKEEKRVKEEGKKKEGGGDTSEEAVILGTDGAAAA